MLGNENGRNYENYGFVFLDLETKCLSWFCSSETEWDFVYQTYAPSLEIKLLPG